MSRKRSIGGREVPSIIEEIVIYDKPNKPLVPREIFPKSKDFVLGKGDIILTRAKDEPGVSNIALEKNIKSEPLETNDESEDDEVPKINSSGDHTDDDSSELEESIENISREISNSSTKPFNVPTAKPVKATVKELVKLPAKPKKQPKKTKKVSETSKKSTKSVSKQDKDVFKKPQTQKSILNFVIVQPKDNGKVINKDKKKGKQLSTVVDETEMNETDEDENNIEQSDVVPEVKETSTIGERQKRVRRRPKKYDDDQIIIEEKALGHYTIEDVAGPSPLKKKKYTELTVVPAETVEWENANTDILDELLEDAQEQVRTLNEVEAELETLVKEAPSSQKSVKTNKKSVRAPARKAAKKPESQKNANVLGRKIKKEEVEADVPDDEVYASDEDSRTEWVPEEYAEYKQQHILKLINKMHKCKFCSSEFSTYYSLRKHRALEHDDVGKDRKESSYSANSEASEEPAVTVGDSDEESSRGEWLPDNYAEYKMKHSINKMKRTQWYKCKICCLVFSNYYKLSKHRVEHEDKPDPYECKNCDAKFNNVESFTAHLRLHQGKDPYKCKKCDKGFKTKEELIEHLPVHILKKPPPKEARFRCDVCGKEFYKLCEIERHTRVHTGEKPSECNICHKRFQQTHNLSKHLLTHLHVRPFQCEICNKKFGRIDVLNRHLLTHSMQKPFKCSLCNKGFIRQVQLNNHFEKMHPDLSLVGLEAMSNEVSVTPVH